MNDAALIGTLSPDRIAIALHQDLRPAIVERLLADRRLAAHLYRLIAGRLGASPPLDPRQAGILAMESAAADALAARAGTVLHAAAILRRIDGAGRRATVAAIGEDAYRLALDAASRGPATEATGVADPAALPAAIERDGRRCFAGWCDAQPPAVAARLRLRHATDALPDGRGVAIVDWLLERP